MHQLSRQIRFAISPSAKPSEMGANSYCAKPTATGLVFYFALWVELKSYANLDTGFVINVSDIDRIIRDKTVKLFNDFVKKRSNGSFEAIGKLLGEVWRKTETDFSRAEINSLTVELAPARKITIKERSGKMLYFSEKFEFSASHTLWNKKFSEKENFKIFGKCANKCGHGHNYIVEVTIEKNQQSRDCKGAVRAGDFERIVDKHFIRLVDHKNLNADVKHFKKANPTVENIAEFAFKSLSNKFKPFKLDCITVWENDRTFCSYKAD